MTMKKIAKKKASAKKSAFVKALAKKAAELAPSKKPKVRVVVKATRGLLDNEAYAQAAAERMRVATGIEQRRWAPFDVPPRRIVQITADLYVLFALCHDGTVWSMQKATGRWERVRAIPLGDADEPIAPNLGEPISLMEPGIIAEPELPFDGTATEAAVQPSAMTGEDAI